jgi:choline dehydrogenase-like flavoprotein
MDNRLAASHSCDICVVGTGPAGITVARQLACLDPNVTICLLESGLTKPTAFADKLRKVDSRGIQIKSCSRERVFGGASSTWSGLSSSLDEIDLSERSWVPNSRWPISRSTLLNFYERAAQQFGFPVPSLFSCAAWSKFFDAGDFKPSWDLLEEKMFIASPRPQRFGQDYSEFIDDRRIRLLLDSTVVRLEGDPSTNEVTHAVVRNSNGSRFAIDAKFFVLACGGIENARLLLVSKFGCRNGLGNEHDQVGRCLMNHPKESYGHIILNRPIGQCPAYMGFQFQGFCGFAGLRLKESVQAEQGLLNSYVRLLPAGWSGSPGIQAAAILSRKLNSFLKTFVRKGRIVGLRSYSEAGEDLGFSGAFHSASGYFAAASQVARKTSPPMRSIGLQNFMEMEPHPDNRVTLGSSTDAFSTPLPVVTHSPTALDKESICAVHDALRAELERSGLGTLHSNLSPDLDPWPINLDASHHMGTTRMGTHPAVSVVNENCKVHSCPNVYVAGSSVFPTCGNANPTYTIVALSIRLAEHLGVEMRR